MLHALAHICSHRSPVRSRAPIVIQVHTFMHLKAKDGKLNSAKPSVSWLSSSPCVSSSPRRWSGVHKQRPVLRSCCIADGGRTWGIWRRNASHRWSKCNRRNRSRRNTSSSAPPDVPWLESGGKKTRMRHKNKKKLTLKRPTARPTATVVYKTRQHVINLKNADTLWMRSCRYDYEFLLIRSPITWAWAEKNFPSFSITLDWRGSKAIFSSACRSIFEEVFLINFDSPP